VIRPGEAGDPRKWRRAAGGAEHFSPAYLVFVTTGEVVSLARVCAARNERRVNRRGDFSQGEMSGRIPNVSAEGDHPSSLSIPQIVSEILAGYRSEK